MSSRPAIPPRYPLRDFFRNPERGAFQLADDGATVSWLQPAGPAGQPARMNIHVQALDSVTPRGEPRRITEETARDIGGYAWKGSRTVLYAKDFGGDENFHIVAVDVASGAATDLTPFDSVRAGILDDLKDDPDHVLLEHNQRDPQVFDVYRVNVHTGAAQAIATNPGNIIGWQTDHDGKLRVALASDGLNTTLLYRDSEDQEFRPLLTVDYRTSVAPALFTFDNRRLYVLSNRGRDTQALVEIDPADPDRETVLFDPRTADLDAVAWSRKRKVLTAALYRTDLPRRHFFDREAEALYQDVAQRLPGYEFALQSYNLDEDKFIVAAYNDRTPGSRYLYDVASGTLGKLADINPALPERDMAQMRPIELRSRDGLVLHGYLTLPPGREPRGLPCIVNPHGGPWARDSWGYNPEAQFFANRGYAVLQVNFRGSTGYGRKFWEASFGQWGLRMQDDITDAVHWVIGEGIADPARIGIYGGSYGGYATLAGIAFTPQLYAAAVDYVGVSNLFTFMTTIPPYWKPLLERMYAMVGHPEKDKERLAATSPALHVDRIRTPLFIAQGAKDPRVNKAESDQVVEALRQRGVEVQYMVKDNEGHGFHNDENKFEFYEAMERFLAQHLKPEA